MLNKNFSKPIFLEFLFLLLVSLGFLVFNLSDINGWYYSAIGDEYAFFNFAKEIAEGRARPNIFSQNGVYQHAPVATSYYQAFFMKILGVNNFGWRASSVFIVVMTIWPLFFWVKDMFDKNTAIISVLIMASSHYLWAFSHTGYWNVQAILPPIIVLFLLFRGIKKSSYFLILLSGISCGFSYLSFYTARISLPLSFLVLLINFFKKKNQKQLKLIFYFLGGFILIFLPFLITNGLLIFSKMSESSLISTQEIRQKEKVIFFFKNIFSSFLAFYQNSRAVHYVSGSLVDLLTGLLFSLGLIIMFFNLKRHYFFIIFFMFSLIIVGGFSPYPYTPITRLYFLVPIIAIIAGLALEKISKNILNNIVRGAFIGIIFLIIFFLNFYRFKVQTPKVLTLTPEAKIMKVLLSKPCKDSKKNVVVGTLQHSPVPLLKPATIAYEIDKKTILLEYFEESKKNNYHAGCILRLPMD